MKVKTLIASAAIAAALPLGAAYASGSATNLSGPQGTGWYGWVDPLIDDERYTMAPPAGATYASYDTNADGVISREEYAAATRDMRGERATRESFSGPSWATNPPAPPQ